MPKYPFMMRFDDSLEFFHDDLVLDKNGCQSLNVYARRWNSHSKSFDTLICTIYNTCPTAGFYMPKYKVVEVFGFSDEDANKVIKRIRNYSADLAKQALYKKKGERP